MRHTSDRWGSTSRGPLHPIKLNAVLSFWLAYILTRPLGASIGDLLSQSPGDGGIGLGTTGTSALFLTVIVLLVAVAQFGAGSRSNVQASD